MNKTLFFAIFLGGLFPLTGQRVLGQGQPAAPSRLTGSAPAYNQITLNWVDNSSNETGFEIEYNGFASWSKVGDVAANVTTYTRTGSGIGGSYRVRAVNGRGPSGYSNELAIQTPPEPPGIPSGLSASAQSQTSIRLTWSNGGGGLAVDYLVERAFGSGGRFSEIATVPYSRTPSYDDNGRSAGTEYCYRVRARNAGGTSDFSRADCATTQSPPTPSAPTDLSANAVSSSQINLSWNTNATFGDGYEVERADNPGGPFSKIADVNGQSNRSYSDQNLSATTQYCYRVRAKNGAGESGFSNTVCATTQSPPTPSAPTDLSANAVSSSQINLSWNTNATFGDGYEVERAVSPGGPFNKIADVNGQNNRTFSDQNLNDSTPYCYRVRAKYQGRFSDFSSSACATTQAPPLTAPTAPARLTATAASSSQINLAWADLATNETGFELERAPAPAGPFNKIADLPADATRFSDFSPAASTSYCYRVRAKNSAGPSAFTDPACATTPAPPTPIPAAPSGLTATAPSSTQVLVSWKDNSSDETGFELERASSLTALFQKIADLPANTSAYTDNDRTASTAYCYRIRAKNGDKVSGYSTAACVTTPAPPATIPLAPTGLSASATSASQIVLTWVDTASDETSFDLERGTDGISFSKIADLPANANTYPDNGLSASTTYHYRIRAMNPAGPSGFSNVAQATTLALVPAAPLGLKAELADYDQIRLTWTPGSANATGYVVERSLNGSTGFSPVVELPLTTSYLDLGLQELTLYFYRVRAKNAAGVSATSEVVSLQTPETVVGLEPEVPPGWVSVLASTGEATVHFAPHVAGAVGLQLFDLKGKIWIRHAAVLVAGGEFTFRTEILPAGLYVILAETNQGVLRTKLIKP